MAARVVDLVDAIVTTLNGGGFSAAFNAERRLFQSYDLSSVDALTVTVGAYTSDRQRVQRSGPMARRYTIIIVVKAPIDTSDDDAIADKLLLAEEIEDALLDARPNDAVLESMQREEDVSQEHLLTQNQWHTIITCQYRELI